MKKIVGIRFKPAGKVYHFDCGAFVLNKGDAVIVETEQGLELGLVAVAPFTHEERDLERPLKKVYRLAVENDYRQLARNRETEARAYAFCLECIQKLGLSMNLFAVESTFDGNKLTFFFTAEGRVDFRQLVKMLVKELGVRVEMRQVGIRNQAKMCGGIGRCGRVLCCSSFIEKFEPISIRMAKEQGLSLNPTKISGQCGRLMCCLTYENDTYVQLKKAFPPPGRTVQTDRGEGKVLRHNLICDRLVIQLADGQEIEIRRNELKETESEEQHH